MMNNKALNVLVSISAIAGLVGGATSVKACMVCDDDGGPTICVDFDNLPGTAPEEEFDFVFDFSDPDNPGVDLLRGDDGQGTPYYWRIWSIIPGEDPTPANIGSITAYEDFDYHVKLLQPDNDPGADNVALIDLDPSGASKFSNLNDGRITGNLTGDLFVQESSGESGGSVSFTVDGNVEGDITAPTISSLSIGGDLSGDLAADDITGSMTIGGDALGDIELVEISGSLTITGDVHASLMVVYGSNGTITTGTVKGTALVKLAQGGDSFDGTATFAAIESPGTVMTCQAALGGTIQVTGNVAGTVATMALGSADGLLYGALIDIDGNVSGQVQVTEDAVGDIDITGNVTSTGGIAVNGDITGDVTVSGYVDGEILANADGYGNGEITGDVTITGEFNGNICGDSLSPMQELPENITIDDFGDDGTICGAAPGCGDGTISSSDPDDETQNSRQPHPPGDCSLNARQGIGSSDEPIEITVSQDGANSVLCWELCETDIEDVDTGQGCSTLSANDIKSVTETSSGVYEIVLDRPISAGEWTTITYLGDDSYVSYASLPADAEADEHSGSDDIGALINYLNDIDDPPFGDYSCDMDHSDVCGPPDILRLIDLLGGTSKFITWNGKTLPGNTCP